MEKIKVIVIIITAKDVMKECLDAILAQDYDNFDIFIHIKKPTLTYENKKIDPCFEKNMITYLNCSANREAARKIALASDGDKFLFVDSDIVIPQGAITELSKQPFDVIAGWYLVRGDNRYTCARWIADNLLINLREVENSVVKVDAMGMGCTMFSRKALSDVYFHHGCDMWAKSYVNGEKIDLMLGECGAIGNLLLDKGYQPYMDGNVICEHLERKEEVLCS